MAFELANRLRLKNLISTDMIREVMRKIISKDLSPVIHKSSFDAYESIRTPSIRIDQVVEGFVSHGATSWVAASRVVASTASSTVTCSLAPWLPKRASSVRLPTW